jgi:hypothetical protein
MVSIADKNNGGVSFSLAEVEKLLPKVEKMVLKLQVLDMAIEMLESVELEIDEENRGQVQYMIKFNKEFHKLCYKYYHLAEKLELQGVVLQDIDGGVVDFPYIYRGKKVMLCWRSGEEKVGHWHEIEECYEGRKKIVDLDLR